MHPVSRAALAVSLCASAQVSLVSPAMAQATGQDVAASPLPAQQTASDPDGQDIVVTGSRISRRDLTSQTPIVTVSEEAVASRGAPTIESTLNQLPQFTPSAGSASSLTSRGGQANLNLRALGSLRTLVLIDGQRLQPANPDGSADLNIIPSSLIDSIETITGGASATYGSDAVAGVVNLKLKHRFHGVELSAQNSVTSHGDGATREIGLTAGTGFAGGRGNVMFAGVYSARDTVFFRDRAFLDDQALSTNTPNGNLLVEAANLPSQAAVNAIFSRYGAAPGSVSRSTLFSFNQDGTIFRPQNTLIGYNGPTDGIYTVLNNSLFGDTGYFNRAQIPLERYSIFGRAEYGVGGSTTLFAQGLYTHYTATTGGVPPNSSALIGVLTIPTTNPFIPADLKALLASRAAPNANFTIQKRFDVLGGRTENDTYDVYQITAGAKGRLGIRDWSWNLYGTLGQTSYSAEQVNYPSVTAVQQLLSAADGGNSLCAGGFNPFGPQPISAACRSYIERNAVNSTSLRQQVVEASLTGGLFTLPGGEVRFAAGADYRRTSYSFTPDPLVASGDLANYLAVGPSRGSINLKEVYAELLVPLLADMPFVRSLNLDLGYRYSDYNITGGATTYKADLDWKPIDAVTFRGGYARAIRAPSVGELFTSPTQDTITLGTLGAIPGGDPCDIRSGYRAVGAAGAANVRALCLTQGVPTALIDSYVNTRTRTPFTTAGNLDLDPEKADTYSIGLVLQPKGLGPLFRRFSLSVDYYNIRIRGAIGSITAPLAVQRCFNADGSNPTYDPTNYFCRLITREAAAGLIANVDAPKLNLGGYRTSGVDIAANWPIGLDDLGAGKGTVTLSTDVGYLDRFEIQTLPGSPFVDYAGTIQNVQVDQFTSARPRWKATSGLRYDNADFGLGLRWRYIGSMDNSANVGIANPTLPRTKSISYFDLDAVTRVSKRFELRAGVANLGNRKPPVTVPVAIGTYNYDLNTYDLVGRRFFVAIKARL